MVERVERRERERERAEREKKGEEKSGHGERRDGLTQRPPFALRGKVAGELRWHGDSRGPRAYNNRASWKTGG